MDKPSEKPKPLNLVTVKPPLPLPNYTLSTVCPACNADTFKLACKVRCPKCGFVWDCSEL
jgi:transposase